MGFRENDNARFFLAQVFNRRNRAINAHRLDDLAIFDRHIEIETQNNALAFQLFDVFNRRDSLCFHII